jgi:hypothetical protein
MPGAFSARKLALSRGLSFPGRLLSRIGRSPTRRIYLPTSGHIDVVNWRLLAAVSVFAVVGCGSPGTVEKQAEDVASIAAEGALLAHDASEGDTAETFTRVHARELAKQADTLRPAIRDTRLEDVVRSVGRELRALADEPGNETAAALLERRLDDAAKRAEEIGKAAS